MPGLETTTVIRSAFAKPFLRWAGGKRQIIRYLLQYVPNEFEQYWEPFLGAGAMFFALAPKRAHLSDSNSDLISCYKYVRDCPELVYHYLQNHLLKTSKEYYYRIRGVYNRSSHSVAQAARFIYLNKTSFNGIFRVNQQGEFNVPYGYKEPPALPSLEDLRAASNILKFAKLSDGSFNDAIIDDIVKPNDFIYFDPPYPPLNETAYFRHYTATRFSLEDHEKVSAIAYRLKEQGCHVMISNADIQFVRELYKEWCLYTLPVIRWIAANGTRQTVAELVITSYPVNNTVHEKGIS